jgi:hypothetical protein
LQFLAVFNMVFVSLAWGTYDHLAGE